MFAKPTVGLNRWLPSPVLGFSIPFAIDFLTLEVLGLAADFWSHSGPGTNEGQADNFHFKRFKKNL